MSNNQETYEEASRRAADADRQTKTAAEADEAAREAKKKTALSSGDLTGDDQPEPKADQQPGLEDNDQNVTGTPHGGNFAGELEKGRRIDCGKGLYIIDMGDHYHIPGKAKPEQMAMLVRDAMATKGWDTFYCYSNSLGRKNGSNSINKTATKLLEYYANNAGMTCVTHTRDAPLQRVVRAESGCAPRRAP